MMDRSYKIHSEADLIRVRRAGVALAEHMGFKEIEIAEIEIAIRELGTNILKYSKSGGTMQLKKQMSRYCDSLVIEARNLPKVPIADADDVLPFFRDGHSSSGSLGIGLSGIRRMVDDFDFWVEPAGELCFRAKKIQIRRALKAVSYSVMNRPKFGETVSGDGYFIRQLPRFFFWSVMDALGHGPEAHRTVGILQTILETGFKKDLEEILFTAHKALKNERGAAMCLGRIHFETELIEYVSVGNIETYVYGLGKHRQLPFLNGTIGVILPDIRISSVPVNKGACIVSFSDGISSGYTEDSDLYLRSPQQITNHIILNRAKDYDDATVLAVRV